MERRDPVRRPRDFNLAVGLLLVTALAYLGWILNRSEPEIAGTARAIDGDSLVVNGIEVRLFGIDAPEARQMCQRGGEPWACGVEAAQALRSAISGKTVVCRPKDVDRYGRKVAVCSVSGVDIAAKLVTSGYALAFGAYNDLERRARTERRGLWSSNFERPAAWRARHPRPAREEAPRS